MDEGVAQLRASPPPANATATAFPPSPATLTSGREGARERARRIYQPETALGRRERERAALCTGSNLRRFPVAAQRPGRPRFCPVCLPDAASPSPAVVPPPRAPQPAPLRAMAKRRAAEPLTFHVPWKRLPSRGFSEAPLLWTPPSGASQLAPSRKRRLDAGAMAESSASPSKRRGGGDGSTPGSAEPEGRSADRGEEPGQPRAPGEEPRDAQPPRGGGDGGAGPAAQCQHNEEFWQYNAFQYWRNPLPPVDLADIEDIGEDSLPEPTLEDKSEGTEVDMEP